MFLAQWKKFLCCFLLLFVSSATANQEGNDPIQFSGFATIGAVISDSDYYGYRKTVNSDEAVYSGEIDFKQHSLLGLQADWNISSNFDFVYQGVIRDLPEPSFDRYTTLAFLSYQANTNWSIRVGRTAPDIFLLTEYRDVDFSYIWATAPNEVYGIVPYRSLDGADVTYSQRAMGGIFTSKFFTGKSSAEISGSEVAEEIKIEDVFGLSLSFDYFNWIISAKHSQVTIANEPESNVLLASHISQVPDILWPNSQEFSQSVLMKGHRVNYSSVSGQYQWNNWLATAELSQISSQSEVIPKITSGYSALSYQIDTHQFYGVYAFADSRTYRFDEPGVNEQVLAKLIHATNDLFNFFAPNQQTFSLGWRWDMTNNTALSLQWNHTAIEEMGSTLWLKKEDYKDADEVNTVLLTLSMVF